jgi:hypothetical protein
MELLTNRLFFDFVSEQIFSSDRIRVGSISRLVAILSPSASLGTFGSAKALVFRYELPLLPNNEILTLRVRCRRAYRRSE